MLVEQDAPEPVTKTARFITILAAKAPRINFALRTAGNAIIALGGAMMAMTIAEKADPSFGQQIFYALGIFLLFLGCISQIIAISQRLRDIAISPWWIMLLLLGNIELPHEEATHIVQMFIYALYLSIFFIPGRQKKNAEQPSENSV